MKNEFTIGIHIVFSFLLLYNMTLSAQDVFQAEVVGEDSLPIPMAVVAIVTSDNQEFFSNITDSNGICELILPKEAEKKYIYVKAFGYNALQVPLPTEVNFNRFTLTKSYTELDGVTITANALSIERKSDRYTILNVYTSNLASGNNIVEILKFVPLVNVTPEEELEILHKGKAAIYVNGRPSNIEPKNIPAENIEKIEVITNPGSEFPSTLKNGIINIILKKNPSDGVLTTITIKDKQKEKWELNNPSLDAFLILQKKKINFTVSFSTTYRSNYNGNTSTYKYFNNTDTTKNIFSSTNRNRTLNENITAMLDWHINEKNTLGFQIGTNIYHNLQDKASTQSEYFHRNAETSDSSDLTTTFQTSKIPNYSLFSNLNYNISFSAKRKLAIDIFYTRQEASSEYCNQNTRNPSQTMITYLTKNAAIINGIDFKTKYNIQFTNAMDLKVGFECYGSIADDDYCATRKQNNDYNQSNHFIYKDITTALYANYNWEISDLWSISAGLRGEYYAYQGRQQATGEVLKNQYPNLFPSFSLVFIPNDDHELSLDFTSRQAIPSYGKRNPFRYYYSPTLYRENNADLHPCKMYDVELSYTLFWDYMLILGYSYTQNIWNEFRILDTETNATIITDENYGNAHFLSAELDIDQQFFNNFVFLSASLFYEYDIYKITNKKVHAYNNKGSEFAADLSIITALCKKKDWKLATTFQYIPISSYVGANLNQSINWNVYITKQLKIGTLSFGVDDILDWQGTESIETSNYSYMQHHYTYGRTYWLSYSVRFGNNATKGSLKRNSTIQERL